MLLVLSDLVVGVLLGLLLGVLLEVVVGVPQHSVVGVLYCNRTPGVEGPYGAVFEVDVFLHSAANSEFLNQEEGSGG